MYRMEETQQQIDSIQKMIKKGRKRGETEPLMPETMKEAGPARKLKIVKDAALAEQALAKQALVQTDTMLVAENDAGMQDGPRKNEIFADVLGRLSALMNKKGDNIRSRIYSRAQDTVLGLTEDITDVKQLEGKPNIGPTILAKLAEYNETGTLHVFEREKAPYIFSKYRVTLDEIESGFLKTAVYDAFRLVANSYTADELISNREQFEVKVRKVLESHLLPEGFILAQFTSNLVYPETFA